MENLKWTLFYNLFFSNLFFSLYKSIYSYDKTITIQKKISNSTKCTVHVKWILQKAFASWKILYVRLIFPCSCCCYCSFSFQILQLHLKRHCTFTSFFSNLVKTSSMWERLHALHGHFNVLKLSVLILYENFLLYLTYHLCVIIVFFLRLKYFTSIVRVSLFLIKKKIENV